MDSILKDLNAAQKAAVTSSASVLQVLAPPGSGKTKTLTARVAYHIGHQQLKPWNIIVCTFTVKAANEMKERIKSFVGDELAKQLKLGTFHSVSLRYLKQYGHHIGLDKDFGIADTADSKAIVKDTILATYSCMKDVYLTCLKRIMKQNDFTIDPSQARGRISTNKAKSIDAEQFLRTTKNVEQQEFASLYQQYEGEYPTNLHQDTLKASNLLDYDDLLLRCCSLLRSRPRCVSNVQALLVDEFQDTNSTQYELMGLFAQQHNVITIVGDPDQSIYGFRSAEIKNLSRMRQQWPDTVTINLEENYRSSGAILHAAQHIIEQDECRPPKRLQATHTFGLRPVLRKLASAAAEADWLVSEVRRMQAMSGNLLQPSDFAVLLRSAALSRVIESALGKAGVPYRMVGGTRFYDRVEVKLLVDYLRVIAQPDNSEAVERIVNIPARRIGAVTIAGLQQEAQTKGISLWSLILDVVQGRCKSTTKVTEPSAKGLASFVNIIMSGRKRIASPEGERPSLVDLLNTVLQKLSFQHYLKSKYPDEYEARWANVEELMAQAADASDPQKFSAVLEANALPSIEGLEPRLPEQEDLLSAFLSNIALTTSSAEKADKDGEPLQQLTISTIHAAKGLEWPVVFVPACYDGSIPHSRADDNDEERRLLYVGMTRAQALLYLSCPIKNTQREETSLSIFLAQPGVSAFFEEHGPSMSMQCVADLATTLKRNCPPTTQINASKHGIERDEDNYWPLNGEEPVQELTRWGYEKSDAALISTFISAGTTMQQSDDSSMAPAAIKPGFTSVTSRFDELMEQSRLRMVDKRAEKMDTTKSSRGQKRQSEPKGSIAGFFKKPCTQSAQPETKAGLFEPVMVSKPEQLQSYKGPLIGSHDAQEALALSRHRPSSKPSYSRPTALSTSMSGANRGYIFLSSPPDAANDDNENSKKEEVDTNCVSEKGDVSSEVKMRPAATLHTTSMQKVAPQRRTLGMRRSLQGWRPRTT